MQTQVSPGAHSQGSVTSAAMEGLGPQHHRFIALTTSCSPTRRSRQTGPIKRSFHVKKRPTSRPLLGEVNCHIGFWLTDQIAKARRTLGPTWISVFSSSRSNQLSRDELRTSIDSVLRVLLTK